MMKADFISLRGGFKFNANHYPSRTSTWSGRQARRRQVRDADREEVFENYADRTPRMRDEVSVSTTLLIVQILNGLHSAVLLFLIAAGLTRCSA